MIFHSDGNMTERHGTSTELPWKIRIIISILSFVADAFCRHHLTFNRRLFNLIDTKCSPSHKPKNGVTTSDILVDPSRNLWFRLYTPADPFPTASLPVIVYFHGGGFVVMSANSIGYDDYCRRLSRELPAVVISVNYRLAPEHRYPSQYEDGIDVLKFIDSLNTKLLPSFADLRHCFLAGDSAGANLAHNVVVLANEHKFEKLKLVGIISIQPFFGGEERTESEIKLGRSFDNYNGTN
ncbi:Alpha/beta hydrolase-3 [Melia azedarach]|uniref:Alpha/beta hydrolase-3 n=1 Tax=Melia azedarach TaxID=155640 RepID=A0ACC1XQZ7_MELAZ|nr:Alpha/beta hydrolase-3 [Melia azedarach]